MKPIARRKAIWGGDAGGAAECLPVRPDRHAYQPGGPNTFWAFGADEDVRAT
jgi:hypothetical protein